MPVGSEARQRRRRRGRRLGREPRRQDAVARRPGDAHGRADDLARRDPDRTRGRLRGGLGRARVLGHGVSGRAAVQRRERNDTSSRYRLVGGAGARGSVAVGAGSVWARLGDSSVFRIDPASRRVVATIYRREHAVRDRVRQSVASGSRTGATAESRASTRRRTAPCGTDSSVGLRPSGVAVGGGAVWVTDTGDDRSRASIPDSNSVDEPFPSGERPSGSPTAPESVWVANSGDGTVSRIDPATSKVVATIRVGNSPGESPSAAARSG